jgi:DNA-binding NarL/FixJ family response regulator
MRSRSPEAAGVRVIILTTFDLDEYVFGALRAGASGFLLKDTLPADLLTAIRVVAPGGCRHRVPVPADGTARGRPAADMFQPKIETYRTSLTRLTCITV